MDRLRFLYGYLIGMLACRVVFNPRFPLVPPFVRKWLAGKLEQKVAGAPWSVVVEGAELAAEQIKPAMEEMVRDAVNEGRTDEEILELFKTENLDPVIKQALSPLLACGGLDYLMSMLQNMAEQQLFLTRHRIKHHRGTA